MIQTIMVWTVIMVAVVSQVATPTAPAVESCPDPRTPLDDISLVLEQYGPVFPRETWKITISDDWNNGHMMFTWTPHNGAASIAYVDLAMWSCGVEEPQLDAYYTDETIDVLVSIWEERTITTRCIVDGVRIIDFDLSRKDGDYVARFWIQQVGETRVIQGNLTLPAADAALMADYAELLYPNAPACK